MKRKSKKNDAITEARILQLSNDLSEDIKSGTVAEWRQVALYFRRQFDRELNRVNRIRPSIAALVTGVRMHNYAVTELDKWNTEILSHEKLNSKEGK